MPQNHQNRQIEQIINNLYYEKLGTIISQLSNWKIKKNQCFTRIYQQPIHLIRTQVQEDHGLIHSQSDDLLEILQQIKDSLSKFKKDPKKSIKTHKKHEKIEQATETAKANVKWTQKRTNLHQLYEFSYKFYSVTNLQVTEINKLVSTLSSFSEKKLQQIIHTYESKFSNKNIVMSIKNNNKYFELSKITEIHRIYQQEQNSYNKILSHHFKMYLQILICSQKLFENIAINFIQFNQFYHKCFGQGLSDEIASKAEKLSNYFKQKWQKQSQYPKQHEKNVRKQISDLIDTFENIVTKAIESISIASYSIELKSGHDNQYHLKKSILTMDNKMIILNSQKFDFNNQFSLIEATIKQSNEGEIAIRDKKGKTDKFVIKFESPERQDEFFLHVNKAKCGTI